MHGAPETKAPAETQPELLLWVNLPGKANLAATPDAAHSLENRVQEEQGRGQG